MISLILLAISTFSMIICWFMPFLLGKDFSLSNTSLSDLARHDKWDLPFSFVLIFSSITFILWLIVKLGPNSENYMVGYLLLILSALAIMGVTTFRINHFYKSHMLFAVMHLLCSSFGVIFFGAEIYPYTKILSYLSIFLGGMSFLVTHLSDRINKEGNGVYIPEIMHTLPILVWAWSAQYLSLP